MSQFGAPKPKKPSPRRDTRTPLSTPLGAHMSCDLLKPIHKSFNLLKPLEVTFNTRRGKGTPADCLRFAHPAEADWRLEVGKPAPRYLGSIQLWNSGSLELWNGVE